jgi:hypothetical protein
MKLEVGLVPAASRKVVVPMPTGYLVDLKNVGGAVMAIQQAGTANQRKKQQDMGRASQRGKRIHLHAPSLSMVLAKFMDG